MGRIEIEINTSQHIEAPLMHQKSNQEYVLKSPQGK